MSEIANSQLEKLIEEHGRAKLHQMIDGVGAEAREAKRLEDIANAQSPAEVAEIMARGDA